MTDETKNEETEGLEETSQEESEESVSEESAEESETLEETSEEEPTTADADLEGEDDIADDKGDWFPEPGSRTQGDENGNEAAVETDEDDEDDEDDERDEFDAAFDHLDESEASDEDDEFEDDEFEDEIDDDSEPEDIGVMETSSDIDGLAAFFDCPNETLVAAAAARDAEWDSWDVFTPFPIHGIEDAMGIGRSWLPWVTFGAGGTGFLTANALQFGTLTFDWPMIIGGKPHAPWPSFVPIMFELTVLIGGVTTALVMLIASGCFRKPKIIDPDITNDRFVLWIASDDPNFEKARAFMQELDPVEIREITFGS